jgi:hypothetical protein
MRVYWRDKDDDSWRSTDSPNKSVIAVPPALPDLMVPIHKYMVGNTNHLDIQVEGTRDEILYMARMCLYVLAERDGYLVMSGEHISRSELSRRIDAALDSLDLRFEE